MSVRYDVDFRRLILPPTATVKRAIEVMSGPHGAGIVLVARADARLLGVVVDSDIRKSILRGVGLAAPLSTVMNPKPVTLPDGLSREEIAHFFRNDPRASIPLVDAKRRIKGLAQLSQYLVPAGERPNRVVMLVGGEGRRLMPLTTDTPKPLLKVGDKPILETIVEQFAAAGLRTFTFAVNHRAEMIRRHFGDGSRLGVSIDYVEERKRLGTAGPLSLLPKGIEHPILVMNGDLLTKVDFGSLLRFHEGEGCLATVCVREYDFQVPFGVVQMKGHRLEAIVEKPTHHFFVNAGIYVVEPKALGLLKRGQACDMPDFLERVRRGRPGSVGCFPVREYWIDIGRIDEYKRAQDEFSQFF
ncbi:MAG: nucleotidyltransferase family protein [Elusimicrobiota bacterium]|nr:nucleotidyltransferase family protein [Elusimicrobiota bacterium]